MEGFYRHIPIDRLVERILGQKAKTEQSVVYVEFKEGYTIPFFVRDELKGVEDYDVYFSPRKNESDKGIVVPSRFELSELELELLRESSLHNQNLVGGSPYRKVKPIIPSAMIKDNKGNEEFSGVLHYVLPEYKKVVVDDLTGEEKPIRTGNYGILVVAGYTGEEFKYGDKNVFFEASKFSSLPSNARGVMVTPYGLLRKDKGMKFFYEWLEKNDKFLEVYNLEKRGKRIHKSPLYEELVSQYREDIEKNRRVEQPRLFDDF